MDVVGLVLPLVSMHTEAPNATPPLPQLTQPLMLYAPSILNQSSETISQLMRSTRAIQQPVWMQDYMGLLDSSGMLSSTTGYMLHQHFHFKFHVCLMVIM